MASAPVDTAQEPVNAFPGEQAAEQPTQPLDLSGLEQDVRDVFAFEDNTINNEPPAAPAPASEPGGGAGQAPASPPVAPPAQPEQPPVAPQPATPAAPASPPAAPSAPAPATPQPPADDPALKAASLEAQVAALTATIEQLRANPPVAQPAQPGQPQAAPGSEQAGAEPPPRYNLSLPEQVTNALTGEDPAQANQAIHWIVNSLATIVHNNLRLEYRKHFDDRVNGLVAEAGQATAEQHQAQTIEQAREQYYEKFADHKNPLIQPIVALEAQKLAAQYPGLTWGDQFMDSLGARVNAALQQLRGEQASAPQPAVPPARPAPMLPASGPAPQVKVGNESQEDLVFTTMQDGDYW